MDMDKKCGNDTEKGCQGGGLADKIPTLPDEWLEEDFMYGFRRWHVIFLSITCVLSFIILLCCCFKFRIPRTKQEIEGDYVRRKILRKFRQRLKAIQNQELDEMDLKRALDKIRAEFKSDTESLAQSEAGFSVATISSAGIPGHHGQSSTYRRASQIQIDISLEDLRAQSMGLGAKMALALSKFFGRSKVSQSEVPLVESGTLAAGSGNKITVEGPKGENIKSTTTAPNTKTQPSKLAPVSITIPEGAVASVSQDKAEKKGKGKSKETKGKDDQCVAPPENHDTAKVVTEKSSKRTSKNKDDAETGKSEKLEKDNKKDKEKEKHDKVEKEKLKADKDKERKDKLEKEREKKEKLEKEKREKKEQAEKEKKEKAEREKKEKATKAKEKEPKGKPGAVKENNIKDKK